MNDRIIRIGTRGSALALKQSEQVRSNLLSCFPHLRIDLEIIKTTGDKIQDVPLAKVGGKGLFVKEIEDALLADRVDLAVHSMKDVPSELPQGLTIGAVPRREDPRDVLVLHGAEDLEDLSAGSVIGTSSLRRAAQILALRPDLAVRNLRGNLDTRLRKVREGQYDGIILAAAGLHRMGWGQAITQYLSPDQFIPAIGQGALGIEVRENDAGVRELVSSLHDPDTAARVEAERSLLQRLEGGCQVPIGGHARLLDEETIELTGLVASLDGKQQFRAVRQASRNGAHELGERLARELLDAGAKTVLDEVYSG